MLLSSVAEAMFWTGRYVERAQALARVVLAYERLSFDLPASRQLELEPLFALVDRTPGVPAGPDRAAGLRELVFQPLNRSSVLGALLAARENLRHARVVAPVELWTTVSDLTHQLEEHAHGPASAVLEALEGTLSLGSRFEGERQAGMTHDSAYAFLELGCSLERADMLVRSLRVLCPVLLPQGWERAYDDVRWTGLLHALGLHSAYRRLYHHRAELPRLLELALSDGTCPRTVVYCLRSSEAQLRQLPRAIQVRDSLIAAVACTLTPSAARGESGLPELAALADLLGGLGEAIASCYFPREASSAANCEHEQIDTAAS